MGCEFIVSTAILLVYGPFTYMYYRAHCALYRRCPLSERRANTGTERPASPLPGAYGANVGGGGVTRSVSLCYGVAD